MLCLHLNILVENVDVTKRLPSSRRTETQVKIPPFSNLITLDKILIHLSFGLIIYSRRSAFLRWLTVTFLFVNLVACLALITLIYDQNEMMKETTPNEQLFLSNTNNNKVIPVQDLNKRLKIIERISQEKYPGIIMATINL